MAESVELKPCPFCGAHLIQSRPLSTRRTATFIHPPAEDGQSRCVIEGTHVTVSPLAGDMARVAAWNRRAPSPEEGCLEASQGEGGSSGAERARTGPHSPVLTDAQRSDGVDHLDPTRWEVTVRVDGEEMLTIGSHGYLAGYSDIDRFGDAIRSAAEHLRSFIGSGEPEPCFACGGHDDGEQLMCEVCGGVGLLGDPAESGASGAAGEAEAARSALDEPTPTSQEAGHE